MMARKTKSHKNVSSSKRTTQKTRSQKTNAKPKTPPGRRRAKTSTAKKASKTPENSSPPMFDCPLLQTYQGLQYQQKAVIDSIDCRESAHKEPNSSSDLFATESLEAKLKSPVQMVSVGIQCALITGTKDASVGTETELRDSGIQTSPQPSTSNIYASVESMEEEDMFTSCSSEYESYESDEHSSDDTLADFDILEEFEDPIANMKDFPERNLQDESKSTISSSPPTNDIYANHRFHSPNSLRLHSKK